MPRQQPTSQASRIQYRRPQASRSRRAPNTAGAARAGYPAQRTRGDWYALRRRRRRNRRLARLGVLAALACVAAAAVFFLLPSVQNLLTPKPEKPTAEVPVAAKAVAAPEESLPIVAIDPGHGGVDRGTEGPGFGEYEMTWRTANDLADLLEADGRFTPYLTITEEESQNPDTARIKPSERAQRAAAQGAQLLLSIHGNSDVSASTSGYECYAIPPGRANHEESLRFAHCLTQEFGALGQRLRGLDGVRYLYYGDNDEKLLYESDDTTVHDDPTFGVLEYAQCPAVLSEQCFLTNSADVDLLADEDGCQRAAQLYYEAICSWFNLEPNQ